MASKPTISQNQCLRGQQVFEPDSQSFSHTENMLHFHLMQCEEVKNGQSQRHEISHLTLPCSLSNTHYFVLSESFSRSACPLSFFILCSSLYICVSIYFLILFLSHPVVKDCRTEVRGKVFSHSLTASKVN